MDYYVFFYILGKYLQFRNIKKHVFGSSHTSNRVHLLRNCVSNYVYLKDMYITLKGTGKIQKFGLCQGQEFFLICKFLNFMAVFAEK